jgi:LAS superfamily LD-carboxypeptidase LdcB|tara:strand:- start:10666 stop:11394 length:729 start_codon:yes stop_codon:yes gene_type:complete
MPANKVIGTDILTGTGNRHLVNLISDKSKDDQTPSLNMQIHQKVLEPFMALKAAAAIEGFDLCICSAYRSFDRQRVIWNDKLAGLRPVLDQFSNPIDLSQLDDWQKIQAVLRWSALPGASRHHWGTDFDIYDAGAMIADYQIQLVPEECKGTGVFAPMHGWLNSMLSSSKKDFYGFYRPYAVDRGGVAPEPWHLSYRPIADGYAEQLSASIIIQQLLHDEKLMYLDTVIAHIDEIMERFVKL